MDNFADIISRDIIIYLFRFLNLNDIFNIIGKLNKKYYNIVHNNCNMILTLKYPKQNINIYTNNFMNLQIIHKIMSKQRNLKLLTIKTENSIYLQSVMILPYNIIASLVDLPKYSKNILAFMNCSHYFFSNLNSFKNNQLISITIFVRSNDIDFKKYKPNDIIYIPNIWSKLIPINNYNETKIHDIHAITFNIKNRKYKIIYTDINDDKENIKEILKIVQKEYNILIKF